LPPVETVQAGNNRIREQDAIPAQELHITQNYPAGWHAADEGGICARPGGFNALKDAF
jgi:hypothetical protein